MDKNTIIKRVSVRKYKPEPLSVLKLLEIEDLFNQQKPLFDVNYRIDLVRDGKSFQKIIGGIVGSYGKVHAPHYLVASTEPKDECYENIGYLVEYIVLKMTEMGLGTCWIGGGIREGLFKDYLNLDEGLSPVVVIAFGYPEQPSIFRKEIADFKRKNLDAICIGEIPEEYRSMMELVQIAPSSVNSQPWRFKFEKKDHVQLFRVKNNFLMKQFIDEMNRIDLGIAICHLEVGANELGKSITIQTEKIENNKLIYFKTIKLVNQSQ